MNKTEFKIKLEQEFDSFVITKKTLQQFKTFKLLNEAPEIMLTSGQIRVKYNYRKKLMYNQELQEQYYIWHLLNTLDSKWGMIGLGVIAKRYYERSKIINSILEEG